VRYSATPRRQTTHPSADAWPKPGHRSGRLSGVPRYLHSADQRLIGMPKADRLPRVRPGHRFENVLKRVLFLELIKNRIIKKTRLVE
jgi:hypothetical protein